MNKKLFCVYDSKSGIYSNPFTAINREIAIRDFAYAVQSDQTELSRYPHDFLLFMLADFDDVSGMITTFPPEHIASAIQFVNKEIEE